MRIVGLTERTPKPITAAVFKKGDVKGANKPGKNLPYFRLDWAEDWLERYIALSESAIERYRDMAFTLHGRYPDNFTLDYLKQNSALSAPELFRTLYGDEPKRVIIANVEFDASLAKFGGNALIWRCDGANICTHWTEKGYSHNPLPCKAPGGVLDACKDANGCDYSGELRFQIPEFSAICGRIVHFVLYTKSPNEIAAMSAIIDSISARTDVNNVPFEMYRYADTFTIPIAGKPSNTTQHMVGLMPFAVASVNRLEMTERPLLAANNGDSADNPDDESEQTKQLPAQTLDLESWLETMATMLGCTPYDGIDAFLTDLATHRQTEADIDEQILKIYQAWDSSQERVLERILHGLAEMGTVIHLSALYVFPFNKGDKKHRYEARLPFGTVAIWDLGKFREVGYEGIDDVKLSPSAFCEKYGAELHQLRGAGYHYLDENKQAWRYDFRFFEAELIPEPFNIPITLKLHTKTDGKAEVQLNAVLSPESEFPL